MEGCLRFLWIAVSQYPELNRQGRAFRQGLAEWVGLKARIKGRNSEAGAPAEAGVVQ